MSLSELPLSYCTNVHPGRTVREVVDGLDRYTLPVMRAYGRLLAAGLWLAKPVVAELLGDDASAIQDFASRLRAAGLSCHTLNAFPYLDGPATTAPVLAQSVAYIECEVRQPVQVGNHTLFLGEIVNAAFLKDEETPVLRMEDTRMNYGG